MLIHRVKRLREKPEKNNLRRPGELHQCALIKQHFQFFWGCILNLQALGFFVDLPPNLYVCANIAEGSESRLLARILKVGVHIFLPKAHIAWRYRRHVSRVVFGTETPVVMNTKEQICVALLVELHSGILVHQAK